MTGAPSLGIDFGTSNTVAVLRRGDGPPETLLFDGSPLLVSAVFADPSGQLLTGRDAAHAARSRPDRFEPNPKRRIDDGTVLLGDAELPVTQLIAAVLARVLAEATRVAGRPPATVTLTHPVSWASRRLGVLTRAAGMAGIAEPRLMPEPVAAAYSFLALPEVGVEPGQSVVVYDLGGGTFDATVVRRTADGFEPTATEGISDLGGLDIDAAVFGYLGAALGPRGAEHWHRLEWPQDAADRRAARLLWDDVRTAKEVLSRASSATVHVPLLNDDLPLGREQLERLARPLLDRTVTTTRNALREAGVPPGEVAGLFLVGGSSRIPLVSTLLFQRLGVAPTVVENPELVVATGTLAAPPPASAPPSAAPAPPGSPDPTPPDDPPPPTPTAPPPPAGAERTPGRAARWQPWQIAAAFVAVLAVIVAVVVGRTLLNGTGNPDDQGSDAAGNGRKEPVATNPVCGRRLAWEGPLTGPSGAFGLNSYRGATLAVTEYNRRHPACTVTLKKADTQGDAPTANNLAAGLVADSAIVGVVGPALSTETQATGGVLNSAGLPFITPTAPSPGLAQNGWRAFHRLVGDDDATALAAASYFDKVLDIKRVFVVNDGSDYGSQQARAVAAALGEDGTAGIKTITPGTTDYTDLAQRIISSGAAAIFFGGYYDDAGRLRKGLSQAQIGAPLVTGDGAKDTEFLKYAGPYAEGTVTLCACAPPERVDPAFGTAFRAEFGAAPGPYAAEAYDAANVFLAAIGNGNGSRPEVMDFVDDYDEDGLTGSLGFDDDGNAKNPTVWAYRFTTTSIIPDRAIK
ncbi:ABC transporter substrate-binding protein [Cryptosporangium phraense]|uniref:ABC transporter substrate-binding protein n=1 Tax=Cryptosporangium phraense TaxID=2593070 RepID=A0A545APJ2_9ACTN|nr:ABC transporter substrate-binding protein [Cryptosporangium phraense]TQS42655.1 ABC transporter substrate-binding protein [Cryptosporangium phraense]